MKKLEAAKPKTLNHTSVRHFYAYKNVREFIDSAPGFHNNLAALSAFDPPQVDKLESLAVHIYGTWMGSARKEISLSQILQQVSSTSLAFLRRTPECMNPDCIRILKEIEEFQYSIVNGFFEWRFGNNDNGTFKYPVGTEEFSRFERVLIETSPKSFVELEPMLT